MDKYLKKILIFTGVIVLVSFFFVKQDNNPDAEYVMQELIANTPVENESVSELGEETSQATSVKKNLSDLSESEKISDHQIDGTLDRKLSKNQKVDSSYEVISNSRILTEVEKLRAELTKQEYLTPKKDRLQYRSDAVYERERDPDWSDKTERGILEGLRSMPDDFRFIEKVSVVQCSDVMCFISVEDFDLKDFRESHMSFIEKVMRPNEVSRFKATRSSGWQSGIYIYRYYSFYIPEDPGL